MNEDVGELKITEEDDEVPYVEFDISVSPSDPSLELLSQQISRNDIVIPFYQRQYVWSIEQASKLVESFLMGLPVPQVFLYANDEGQLEVIDGQQRLMSMKYFFEGYFGEPDSKGKRQTFRLKGLAQRSEYNGRLFTELDLRDQRKLKNSTLRAINIRQLKPNDSGDSVFHIFERLNTGGTRLKPQEIRNAVYRGQIVDSLKRLNNDPNWRAILGLKKPDKNQKDVELILRLFALFGVWGSYEKPMLTYLNKFMSKNASFESSKARAFEVRFLEVTELVNASLQRPFRPRGLLNAAVLEAVMVALLEDNSISSDELKQKYSLLLSDKDFTGFITGGTTDTLILQGRIAMAKKILSNAA